MPVSPSWAGPLHSPRPLNPAFPLGLWAEFFLREASTDDGKGCFVCENSIERSPVSCTPSCDSDTSQGWKLPSISSCGWGLKFSLCPSSPGYPEGQPFTISTKAPSELESALEKNPHPSSVCFPEPWGPSLKGLRILVGRWTWDPSIFRAPHKWLLARSKSPFWDCSGYNLAP